MNHRIGCRLLRAIARGAPQRLFSSNLLSSELSPTSITMPEAVAILDSTFTFIRLGLPGRKLDGLKDDGDATVQEKWESMMQIRVGTELHVIAAFGYEPTSNGMLAYRQVMNRLLQDATQSEREAIQKIDQDIWAELIHRTYAIIAEPMQLLKAREVVLHVTSALQEEDFRNQLMDAIEELGASASETEKNKKLQFHLLQIWRNVLPKFGFPGDDGYVKFQAALVEHSSDPTIATMIQGALMDVTTRAGLAQQK